VFWDGGVRLELHLHYWRFFFLVPIFENEGFVQYHLPSYDSPGHPPRGAFPMLVGALVPTQSGDPSIPGFFGIMIEELNSADCQCMGSGSILSVLTANK
jgi:hypothetical protein